LATLNCRGFQTFTFIDGSDSPGATYIANWRLAEFGLRLSLTGVRTLRGKELLGGGEDGTRRIFTSQLLSQTHQPIISSCDGRELDLEV
jgi:hypothetical protein